MTTFTREDFEMAAKAARAAGMRLGGSITWTITADEECLGGRLADGSYSWWSPPNDDGDALRLAVALRIQITQTTHGVRADSLTGIDVLEPEAGNRNAATRRAIFRAAIAIGRAMP